MIFYDQVVCFGTMDGSCILFQTDVDVRTLKSDSFIKLSCVSDHSISGIVLAADNLWVSTYNQILLLNCESLDVVRVLKPPKCIDLPIGKLALSEGGGDKIWSAFMGGFILSLWDVQNKTHFTFVNIQQVLQERCHVNDPIDVAITAMNVALDTVWVGMGSGHILVFASSAALLTVLKPYKYFVRFLVPLSDPERNRYMMISGGKDFEPDESLDGLPHYPQEYEKVECVDKAGVVVLWDVLPAKYLRHVQYLSSGKAWLNYSTLEEAVQDTGLITQAVVDPLVVNSNYEATCSSSDGDLTTGCSLADFQTSFKHAAGSTASEESTFDISSHFDLSEDPYTDTTTHSDTSPTDDDDSEQQKELISFTLPDNSTIALSFQKPVTIKALIIDVLNSMADAQTVDIALYYPQISNENNLIPLKSQAQLEEYLAINRRPTVTVHSIK